MQIQRLKISEEERILVSVFMGEEYPNEIDFNRLMPVVEKILQLNVFTSYQLWVSDSLRSADINTVRDAVIDFIQWYKKQTK
jgi:hypothetical protein